MVDLHTRAPSGRESRRSAYAASYNDANPGYGFQGDPLHPISGKNFGYLIRAACIDENTPKRRAYGPPQLAWLRPLAVGFDLSHR